MFSKGLRGFQGPLLLALGLLVPAACVSVATFIVQQYEGEERPKESISILRLNPAEPVILVALDDEKLDFAVTEPDSRVHIEMLPGQHVLDVGTIQDPIGVQRIELWTSAGATYRIVLHGSANAQGATSLQSGWVASVVQVNPDTDQALAVAPTAEPRPPQSIPPAAPTPSATAAGVLPGPAKVVPGPAVPPAPTASALPSAAALPAAPPPGAASTGVSVSTAGPRPQATPPSAAPAPTSAAPAPTSAAPAPATP